MRIRAEYEALRQKLLLRGESFDAQEWVRARVVLRVETGPDAAPAVDYRLGWSAEPAQGVGELRPDQIAAFDGLLGSIGEQEIHGVEDDDDILLSTSSPVDVDVDGESSSEPSEDDLSSMAPGEDELSLPGESVRPAEAAGDTQAVDIRPEEVSTLDQGGTGLDQLLEAQAVLDTLVRRHQVEGLRSSQSAAATWDLAPGTELPLRDLALTPADRANLLRRYPELFPAEVRESLARLTR